MASLLTPTRRLQLVARHLTPSTPSTSLAGSSSSSRFLSTSASRNTPRPSEKYPYIFTTSAAFHGKNLSPPPSRVKQGLPNDHPLVAWRTEVLKDGPKHGAGHDAFFVEGVPRESKELQEGEQGVKGVVMGVADGVGGWEEQGVDPSHFSQALMFFARERVRLSPTASASSSTSSLAEKGGKGGFPPWTWPADPSKRDGNKLKELLKGAFEDVKTEEGIVAGSSTACLVALDAETGMLHAANLGDSGFYVFRPSTSPAPSSGSDSPAPASPQYTLLQASTPQIYFFNAPYQLSKFPPEEDTSNALLNHPKDADSLTRMQLEDGDVVMVVTDGFSDNVFEKGEADVLVSAVRQKLDEHFASQGEEVGRAERDKELASSIARTAVSFARMIAVREDKTTPFELEAKRWRVCGRNGEGFKGGKVDDVTVVVAVVRKEGAVEGVATV